MHPSFAPRRELGRTGFVASLLGVGDLADRSQPLAACVATLRRALDHGLNVVDTAPSYEQGFSEEIVGAALEGRRDGVFVIDKVDHFDRAVRPQLEQSLQRLRLPHADLFVFHGVSSLAAWQELSAPGGRFDELVSCARDRLCKFVGISSHHPDVVEAAIESGRCDVVMFPVGAFVDPRYVEVALPLARARGVGSVCFKTFGAGKLLGDTSGYGQPLAERPRDKWSSGGVERAASQLPALSVSDCVRYTLTCDPDVALLGLSFPNEQDAAFEAAAHFSPLTESELATIRERAQAAIAGKGRCWWNPAGP